MITAAGNVFIAAGTVLAVYWIATGAPIMGIWVAISVLLAAALVHRKRK